MTPPVRHRVLQWLEWMLVAVGIAALSSAAYLRLAPTLYRLEHAGGTAVRVPGGDALSPAPLDVPPAAGALIGTLEIPRLGFSGTVAEGDDAGTLRVAVGHLPDTPLPWSAGNSALAGHRDAAFRSLSRVRVGDDVQLVTAHGTLFYRIRAMKIVAAEDLSVLAPTTGRTLTLITCYPFVYVGHAPKRFIVIADAADLSLRPGS